MCATNPFTHGLSTQRKNILCMHTFIIFFYKIFISFIVYTSMTCSMLVQPKQWLCKECYQNMYNSYFSMPLLENSNFVFENKIKILQIISIQKRNTEIKIWKKKNAKYKLLTQWLLNLNFLHSLWHFVHIFFLYLKLKETDEK